MTLEVVYISQLSQERNRSKMGENFRSYSCNRKNIKRNILLDIK
jgi:hypothetical protein